MLCFKQPTWEEEVVEYPSRAASYANARMYPGNSGGRYVRDAYPEDHVSQHAYVEEPYDSTIGDPIPIVQRENSLTRMRDMFTDHGRASHAVTEVPLPGGTNRFTVADMQSPVEVHGAHPYRHQPVIINNTTTHSVRPDTEHTEVLSERAQGKRPERRRDFSPEVSVHADRTCFPSPYFGLCFRSSTVTLTKTSTLLV